MTMELATNLYKHRIKAFVLVTMVCGAAVTMIVSGNALTYFTAGYDERISATPSDKNRLPEKIGQNREGEKRHLVFIKIHKAGGSTVTNVLIRFGVARNLTFALPEKGTVITFLQHQRILNVMPSPKGQPFDILCSHSVYNRRQTRALMHPDSVYIAIVREPVSQIHSSLYYFHRNHFPVKDKLSAYIDNPQSIKNRRLLNNSMSYELGLPEADFSNEEKIRKHLAKLDREFDIILVTERMEESLLLLKRFMGWTLRDIIYFPRNVNYDKPTINVTDSQLERLRHMDLADSMLHEFSVKRLNSQIATEHRFGEELAVYTAMLKRVRGCLRPGDRKGGLKISGTEWNEPFTINREECDVLQFNGFKILNYAKRHQYPKPESVQSRETPQILPQLYPGFDKYYFKTDHIHKTT